MGKGLNHGQVETARPSRQLRFAYCSLAIAFLVHAAEECVTRFYLISPFFDLFSTTGRRHAAFLALEVLLFLFMGITFFFLHRRRVIIVSASFTVLFFLVELEHYIEAVGAWRYVPGLVSALFLPVFMAWFVFECVRELRDLRGTS